MWRIGLLVTPITIGLVCGALLVNAQESKHFRIEHNKKYQSVTLNYSSSNGVCYLAQGDSEDPLSVYSARDIDEFNHSFDRKEINHGLNIELVLEEKNNQSFSQSISNKVFSKSKPEDNTWKVMLAEDIPYNLNLTYGIGEAYIDLSGLSVANMKVKTGSADVNIGYLSDSPNHVEMDNMNINVDLGNVYIRQLYMANVRNIKAEVGFGNMLLDFSETMNEPCHVVASVGAGELEIVIPKNDIPIIIRVKKSMLCDVKLTKSFAEIEKNIYSNTAGKDEGNTLVFDVDVSFGNIIFKEKR